MIDRLATLPIDEGLLSFRDEEALCAHLGKLEGVDVAVIGASREGRHLYGVRLGTGERRVSIIAGCHADEPVGPMTAQALPALLQREFPELLERYVFHIVPQMNPDGAARNRAWFADRPGLAAYLQHAVRELPGDDIEFGFGEGDAVRPECRAAQDFLAPCAPFAAHFSLHGMAFAEGAWCLICPEWTERAAEFMNDVAGLCARVEVPLHDVDRKGEKGFNRLREGFSTTPNSRAMKEFFLERNDAGMAGRFMPTSMEWIRSSGGDPLCIVTELPLFLVGKRSPNLEEPIKAELREDLTNARALPASELPMAVREITARYALSPMPVEMQVRLQLGMIVLGLITSEGHPDPKPG